MNYLKLHPWKVSPLQALKIQEELKNKVILKNCFLKIERVAGADIAYSKKDNRAFGGVIVFSFPELTILERKEAEGLVSFPYIPGLLTFREGPVLLKAFRKVKEKPDLIIFDGQGIAHYNRLGIATHLGILLDKPTIGCAKSKLVGRFEKPENMKGAYSYLKVDNQIVGAVLRTRRDVKPVFISPGFKIDLETSIRIVLECCRKYRLPEPSRQAHIWVNRLKALGDQ